MRSATFTRNAAHAHPSPPTKGTTIRGNTAAEIPRRFHLYRHHDISHVSGKGIIADGTQYPGGLVSLCWRGNNPSISMWTSIHDMIAIHGHNGATELIWIDPPEIPNRRPGDHGPSENSSG